MPVYEYTALDVKGKNVSGIIDAESALSARQKLRANKTYPVNIKEVADAKDKKESRGGFIAQFFTRIRPSDVALMTRQLRSE